MIIIILFFVFLYLPLLLFISELFPILRLRCVSFPVTSGGGWTCSRRSISGISCLITSFTAVIFRSGAVWLLRQVSNYPPCNISNFLRISEFRPVPIFSISHIFAPNISFPPASSRSSFALNAGFPLRTTPWLSQLSCWSWRPASYFTSSAPQWKNKAHRSPYDSGALNFSSTPAVARCLPPAPWWRVNCGWSCPGACRKRPW